MLAATQRNIANKFSNLFSFSSSDEKKQHFKIHISGRVQSVWFRPKSKKKARELGITGFIQHTLDGLYLEIEGTENALSEFIEWCKIGPSLAKVEKLVAEKGELKGFRKFVVS